MVGPARRARITKPDYEPVLAQQLSDQLAVRPTPWFVAKEPYVKGLRGVGYGSLYHLCDVHDAIGQRVGKKIPQPLAMLFCAAAAQIATVLPWEPGMNDLPETEDGLPPDDPRALVAFASLVSVAHAEAETRRLAQKARDYVRPEMHRGDVLRGRYTGGGR